MGSGTIAFRDSFKCLTNKNRSHHILPSSVSRKKITEIEMEATTICFIVHPNRTKTKMRANPTIKCLQSAWKLRRLFQLAAASCHSWTKWNQQLLQDNNINIQITKFQTITKCRHGPQSSWGFTCTICWDQKCNV